MDTHIEVDEYAANNGFVRPISSPWSEQTYSIGMQTYYDYAMGSISESERDVIINNLRKNDAYKEYSDLFLRNSFVQQHNLSVSHAKEKFSYYSSINYMNDKDYNKGVDSERFGVNLKGSADVVKGVRFSTQVNLSKQENELNGAPGMGSPVYNRILDENGNYINQPFGLDESVTDALIATGNYPYDWDYNLKREFDNQDNESSQKNVRFRAQLDFDLYKGLKAELSYNYQYGRTDDRSLQNEELYSTRNTVNGGGIYDVVIPDPSMPWITESVFNRLGIPKGNIYNQQYFENTAEGTRGQLTYNGFIDADDKHYISALAGIEYKEESFERRIFETLYGYNPQTLTHQPVDFVNEYPARDGWNSRLANPRAQISKQKNRYLSNYANVAYTFNNKYNITGSWRLDDSNLFGSSSKYRNVPLWSVGAKWRLGEEDFMNLDFLNSLDVRATIGTGGRINRGSSPYMLIRRGVDSWTTGQPYALIHTHENEELRWETTRTLNLGVDFAMFNRRLSGTVEYYNKYTSDVLGAVSTNPTWGYGSQFRNYAEISNKGVDVTLNYNAIRTNDFNWNVGFNMNYNKNTIEEVDQYSENMDYYTGGAPVNGNPLSGFYSYRWAGLSNEGTPQVYDENGNLRNALYELDANGGYATQINPWTGQEERVNASPVDSKDALVYSGQRSPKYFGGLRNTVSWKDLSFNMMLTYKLGHKFRRASAIESGILNGSAPVHEDLNNRWRNPGDELNTDVPALSDRMYSSYVDYYKFSNLLVEDASHIRIQSISLTYNISKSLLQNTFIKKATIGVNAQNLGILWSANGEGIDPDYGNGIGTFKSTPTYSLNLNINF